MWRLLRFFGRRRQADQIQPDNSPDAFAKVVDRLLASPQYGERIGMRATEHPVHVHDIHATILHMLGLNHLQLTYMHNGRAERPTVLAGQVIKEVFS